MDEKPQFAIRDFIDAVMGLVAVAAITSYMLRHTWTSVSVIEYSVLILAVAFILWNRQRDKR
jgi:hypothetical protein